MLKTAILLVLGVVVAGAVYVRLAPTDRDAVHLQASPRAVGDYPADNGFLVVREITAAPEVILNGVAQSAVALGRTAVLAGSATDGMITLITRSRLMGYPDYTTASIIPADTVENAGPLLMIDARARFGKYDMGVNMARVEAILDALGPLTVPRDGAN